QLGEERLLRVLGVVPLGERTVDDEQFGGAHRQAARLEPAEDLAREAAANGVRLDQDEGALQRHAAESTARPSRARRCLPPTPSVPAGGAFGAARARRPGAAPSSPRRRTTSGRPASRSTGTPATAARAGPCS